MLLDLPDIFVHIALCGGGHPNKEGGKGTVLAFYLFPDTGLRIP